jgi:hypothetical protein
MSCTPISTKKGMSEPVADVMATHTMYAAAHPMNVLRCFAFLYGSSGAFCEREGDDG